MRALLGQAQHHHGIDEQYRNEEPHGAPLPLHQEKQAPGDQCKDGEHECVEKSGAVSPRRPGQDKQYRVPEAFSDLLLVQP